jgi:hypothetical protein
MRKLGKDNIIPRDPTFSTDHARVRENRFWPYFKGAIGAVDGSHVKVVVPVDEVVNHTCRHGYTSQNVLAISRFDMRFTFVVASWPGAARDTCILNHALANFPSFFVPPKGMHGTSFPSFYVSCTCIIYFTSLVYFYTKILSRGFGLSKPNRVSCTLQRKHISHTRFRHRTDPPQGKYEVFNFLHSSLQNVIERSFVVLKQKWCFLTSMPSFSPRTQKHIIIDCFALHNFIRDSNLRDKEFERCDADEQYLVPSISATTQTQEDGSEDVGTYR